VPTFPGPMIEILGPAIMLLSKTRARAPPIGSLPPPRRRSQAAPPARRGALGL